MPTSALGQLITFAVEVDDDQKFATYRWVTVGVHTRTIRKIAAKYGHIEDAKLIAKINGVRSVDRKLPLHKRLKVPGRLRPAAVFHVLAGDTPPTVIDGYAKFETVDRPQRTGLTHFTGYNPMQIKIPITFESWRDQDGTSIERDIALLERMAGRGHFAGAASGPPPIIHVSTTNSAGDVVPLLPTNYQWRSKNTSAPMWRIVGIDWDESPLRGPGGNRLRQHADVTIQQHNVPTRALGAAGRSKAKKKSTKQVFGADGRPAWTPEGGASIGDGLLGDL